MEELKTINTTNGITTVPNAIPGKKAGRAKETTKFNGKGKTIVLLPQTGRQDEVRTFRINSKPYYIKVGQAVTVPDFLYDHIMDLANRKKLSAKAVQAYIGDGRGLGDLK